MSQNQPTSNQKRPAPTQNRMQAPNQNRPAPNQNRPAPNPNKAVHNQKKPAPAPQKAPKTQAFNAVNSKNKGNKPHKPNKKLVIAVCVVIVLILAALLVLIIGNIMNKIQNPPTVDQNVAYVEKTADEINIGNLLLINSKSPYVFPSDFSDMINVYLYQRNAEYKAETHINDAYTYSLSFDNVLLKKNTLDALNKMIMDYCIELGTSASSNSASNIEIAWGGYNASNLDEYEADIEKNKDFYDHALGTTFTIKSNEHHTPIKEQYFKTNYTWLYQNASKYGFIIRYPDDCQEHTGFNSKDRLHLRYVGVEHATYIYENGICLEEYLELLRTNHGYNNPLTVNANGKEYQVYYVKCEHQSVQVPVPKDASYTISGDNMNGFIVTVEK